jgi:hypothetical protein
MPDNNISQIIDRIQSAKLASDYLSSTLQWTNKDLFLKVNQAIKEQAEKDFDELGFGAVG